MKFLIPVLMLATLFSQHSFAQVVVEDGFKFGTPREGEEFDAPAQKATESIDWPIDDNELRVTEVKFTKKAKTKWHRNKGPKYLITTDGTGEIEWYNSGGQLLSKKIGKSGRVYVPAHVCHRHGSDGKVFSQIVVTTAETKWDECHEEFIPQGDGTGK